MSDNPLGERPNRWGQPTVPMARNMLRGPQIRLPPRPPVPAVPAAPTAPQLAQNDPAAAAFARAHNNILFLWKKLRDQPWRDQAIERGRGETSGEGDEHALAAAHLRPVHGNAPAVDHDAAYRRAAHTISRLEGREYTPEEVRSVAREGARNLFTDEHRAVHETTGEPTHRVGRIARDGWNAAHYGLMHPGHIREMIYRAAGGVKTPPWAAEPAASKED